MTLKVTTRQPDILQLKETIPRPRRFRPSSRFRRSQRHCHSKRSRRGRRRGRSRFDERRLTRREQKTPKRKWAFEGGECGPSSAIWASQSRWSHRTKDLIELMLKPEKEKISITVIALDNKALINLVHKSEKLAGHTIAAAGLSRFQSTYGVDTLPPNPPGQYRPRPGAYDPALDPNRHMIPGGGASTTIPPLFLRNPRGRNRLPDSPLWRHPAADGNASDDGEDGPSSSSNVTSKKRKRGGNTGNFSADIDDAFFSRLVKVTEVYGNDKNKGETSVSPLIIAEHLLPRVPLSTTEHMISTTLVPIIEHSHFSIRLFTIFITPDPTTEHLLSTIPLPTTKHILFKVETR